MLGTQVIAHEKPLYRRLWTIHGVNGWYLGRAPEDYRCYRVYITTNRSDCIADTVEFFPEHVTTPTTLSADCATFATLDLVEALQNPSPAPYFAAFDTTQLVAL
jgi:hypothetical protein